MEEEKLLLNKITHFSFNQESISYIMDIKLPCLVDLKFPCVLSQRSQTRGLIHLNFHKHCLCEEQCALVHWDICHPIPLLRENERWVQSLPCIPFVSACMGLGTTAARRVQAGQEAAEAQGMHSWHSCGADGKLWVPHP